MKTVKETVSEIIRSDKVSLESDSVEKLIYMAYYIGLEKGCKQATDEYKAVLQGQLGRVKACRYHRMAMAIQGNVKFLYDPNYGGTMTSTFGEDKTEVLG